MPFALSLIKVEKQARKLMTYLVYQHPWCRRDTIPELKRTMEESTEIYFKGLLAGWNALYPRSVEQLVGADYARLRARLAEATKHRNKIFHGQLSGKDLSRQVLVEFVSDIREWCDALGRGAQSEVGYDGCGRNSFRKAPNAATLCGQYKKPLADLEAYKGFIKEHMERKSLGRCRTS